MDRIDDLLKPDGRHVFAAGVARRGVVAAQVGREVCPGSRGDGALRVGVVRGDAGGQGRHTVFSRQFLLEGALGGGHGVGLAAEGLARPKSPRHVLVAFSVFHGGRAARKDCKSKSATIV